MLKKAIFMAMISVLAFASFSFADSNSVDGMVPGQLTQSYLNPGGLGDSLLYGYYNVRGNINIINLVNTDTTDGAKVRVVFRNAKDSRECLDFSVCLSRGDVWTAYLVDNGTTAAICPVDPDTFTSPALPSSCQAFKYAGGGGLAGITADDCREGYFEVIGMTGIQGFDHTTCPDGLGCIITSEADCRNFNSSSIFSDDVDNTLFGNNTIAAWDNLATYSYNATAVADTRFSPIDIPAGRELSIPFAMSFGCDEADFIFTKSSIVSPYDLIAGIGGETEVIVTFPTKLECHVVDSNDPGWDDDDCDTMFSNDGSVDTGCCVPVGIEVWNNSEETFFVSEFSPAEELCLPYEANVLKLGSSNIWNSTVASILSTGTFDMGWVDVDLFGEISDHGSWSTFSAWYWQGSAYYDVWANGLPAVAYTTQSFAGGQASYLAPAAFRVFNELYLD